MRTMMMNNAETAASSLMWAKTDGLCKQHAMPHLLDNMREKRDTICEFSESVSSWPPLLLVQLASLHIETLISVITLV